VVRRLIEENLKDLLVGSIVVVDEANEESLGLGELVSELDAFIERRR
jgi:hypothetical protein